MRITLVLLLTLCAALSSARAQTIVEYPIPTSTSEPAGITAGPDGNLWFTERGCTMVSGVCLSKIGKITLSGVITEYTIPTPASYPAGIAAGPDGNLWFCEQQASNIGRITPSGVITEYPVPSGLYTYGITAGPDGNVWFTESLAAQVGKITPDGVITEYATDAYGLYYSITAGSDGRLWFGSSLNVGQLDAITTDGVTKEINLTYSGGVLGIATGPDGKIWYTSTDKQIARSDPNTPGIVEVYNPKQGGQLGMITRGPANDLWFTVQYGNNGTPLIGRVTTAGDITEFPLTNTLAAPFGITTGPDGNIWFTEYGGNAIGVVLVSSGVTTSSPAPTIAAVVNAASFASGPVAPGEIVTLSGTALGPSVGLGLQLDSTGKVATALGGVTVSFSGHAAPLIYVSDTQINCVAPYEIAGEPNPQVQVQYAGLTSNAFPLRLAAAAPGIFTENGSGTGLAAALNTANCPAGGVTCNNDSSSPAPQGSVVVIYATGEGLTNPAGVTGGVTTVDSTLGDPLTPQPQAPLTVTVGGEPAAIAFLGEAPGTVAGVLQVNLQIPTGLTSGNLPLVILLGGIASQSGITIAVQ